MPPSADPGGHMLKIVAILVGGTRDSEQLHGADSYLSFPLSQEVTGEKQRTLTLKMMITQMILKCLF
jgi:hypothetical protein